MATTEYRPLSSYSVASVALLPLCMVGFVVPVATFLSLAPFIVAALALADIRRYQFAGRQLALSAMIAAPTAAVVTGALLPYWNFATYASEAPVGYQREDFAKVVKNNQLSTLVGKEICLKGYPTRIFSSWSPTEYTSLSVSPDGNADDALLVQLPPDEEMTITFGPLAISGTLVANEEWREGSNVPQFILRNAVIRKSKTPHELIPHYFPKC